MLVLNEKPKRFLNAKRRTTLKPIVDNPKISKSLQKKLNKIFRGMYDETEELFNSDKETKRIIKGLRVIKEKYDRIANKYALSLAERWTNETNSNNRDQLFDQLKDHLGVDRAYLLDSEEFSNVFNFNLMECVALIKSIPTEYLGKVAEALKREFNGEGQPEGRSLVGQIKEETGISTRRAKLIARDQTSKMNAQFNQVRQQDLGIEEYFTKKGITIIEWADMIPDYLPEERLDIKIKNSSEDEDKRIITIKPYGAAYEELCEAIL